MEARVLKSTGSWYVVETLDNQIFNARLRGKIKQSGLRLTNPIAAGDRVVLRNQVDEEGNHVIDKILPRSNYVARKSTNLSKEMQILAANIDHLFVLVTLKDPKTHPLFVDRFLVAAESFRIPVSLLFNKVDLYSNMEEAQYEEWAQQYEKIGYSCYRLQGNKASSADFLKELMKGQQVMLGGNSGVGKSTVINALDASVRLRTGSISVAHQQGKHTTTFAEMHKLNFGAYVIDTPGIRSFGLVDLEKEHLGHYFPEIRAVMEACRFNNCLHLNEPGCAVRNALQAGQIAQQRYRNYVAMVEEENDDPYRRNKFS
ncbi:MAG: ribosome small subunit-dependent GTPase A [Crocinitomicaceae bacterium]